MPAKSLRKSRTERLLLSGISSVSSNYPKTMLTFHLIYTPHTVALLSRFLPTLLNESDCMFRLIANGCTDQEITHLRNLCQNNDRLEFLALPTARPLWHGPALNYLQAINDTAYFCFMDSDIFATGPFLPRLTAELAQADACFSCAPIGCTDNDALLTDDDPLVQGILNRTSTGLCLGSTYLAIYAQPALRHFIRTTGIGFEPRYWAEIPAAYQEILLRLGLQRAWHDTGKVLNLLLYEQGQRLAWCEIPTLRHLGGISLSDWYPRQRPRTIIKAFLQRAIKHLLGTGDRQQAYLQTIWQGTGTSRLAQIRRRELEYARYFHAVLTALDTGRPLPALPLVSDALVKQRFSPVTQELKAMGAQGTG